MIDRKKWVKNGQNFKCFEIHRVDSLFNEDSKNIFFFGQGSPHFGEEMARKFRESGQTRETLCYAN